MVVTPSPYPSQTQSSFCPQQHLPLLPPPRLWALQLHRGPALSEWYSQKTEEWSPEKWSKAQKLQPNGRRKRGTDSEGVCSVPHLFIPLARVIWSELWTLRGSGEGTPQFQLKRTVSLALKRDLFRVCSPQGSPPGLLLLHLRPPTALSWTPPTEQRLRVELLQSYTACQEAENGFKVAPLLHAICPHW